MENDSESRVSELPRYPEEAHRRIESVIEHSYDSGESEAQNDPTNISATLYTSRNSNKARQQLQPQGPVPRDRAGARTKDGLEKIDSSSEYPQSNS